MRYLDFEHETGHVDQLEKNLDGASVEIMKEYPKANYPIKIFSYTDEYEMPASKYYEGSYGIWLNRVFQVGLSPSYNFYAYGFPPNPETIDSIDVDHAKSYDEARVINLLLDNDLVILENNQHIGKLVKADKPPIEDEVYKEHFPDGYSAYYIYCISSEDYQLFSSELEAIMDMEFYTPAEKSITDVGREFMVLENLKVYKCIGLIHSIISQNRYILSPYSRKMLCLE